MGPDLSPSSGPLGCFSGTLWVCWHAWLPCWSHPTPPHQVCFFRILSSRAGLCSQRPCSAISSRLVENRADFPLAGISLSFLQVASLICPLPVLAWMASSWDVVVDSDSFCFSLYLLKPCTRLLPNVWIHKLRNSKVDINSNLSQACWRVSVISDFRRLRQEDTKFQVSLGTMVKFCLKNKTKPSRSD